MSNENFENKLYNTFEENTEKIVRNFDNILYENNKEDRNEEKIINIYMQTQELIYTTYFSKMYKRLTTIKEVDEQVKKLENYEEIVGKLLNVPAEEDEFNGFKNEMNDTFLKKYIEINRNQSKNTLSIVYKNAISNFLNKIANFIQRKIMRT